MVKNSSYVVVAIFLISAGLSKTARFREVPSVRSINQKTEANIRGSHVDLFEASLARERKKRQRDFELINLSRSLASPRDIKLPLMAIKLRSKKTTTQVDHDGQAFCGKGEPDLKKGREVDVEIPDFKKSWKVDEETCAALSRQKRRQDNNLARLKVSWCDLYGKPIRKHDTIPSILGRLASYCNDVSWYAMEKAVQSRRGNPVEKVRQVDPLHDIRMMTHIRLSDSAKDRPAMIVTKANWTRKQIIGGLKKILFAVRIGRRVCSWRVLLEQTVFQLLEHMSKFQLIDHDQLKIFFSNGAIMKLVGQHISELFRNNLHAFAIGNQNSAFEPHWHYITTASETQHLHHCLAGLDEATHDFIIHKAFSNYYLLLTDAGTWIRCESQVKEIAKFIADRDFLHHQSQWMRNTIASNSETSRKMSAHATSLIDDFMSPKEVPLYRISDYKDHDGEYVLKFLLLKYITQNLEKRKLIQLLDGNNQKWEVFQERSEFISVGKELSKRIQEWKKSDYDSRCDGLVQIRIAELFHRYWILKQHIQETEAGIRWINSSIVDSICHEIERLAWTYKRQKVEEENQWIEKITKNFRELGENHIQSYEFNAV